MLQKIVYKSADKESPCIIPWVYGEGLDSSEPMQSFTVQVVKV